MALQVWLPLTGNLENKGLNGATVTNTNATANSSGKIGQCYMFSATSSSNSHLYLPTTIDTSIKTWSYCCWLKVISFPVGYVPLYTQRATTNSTARSIFLKSTEIIVDNGVRATISKTLPTLTNWNHFAFVCSATQIKVYVNGELFDTKTITNTAYSGISNDATIGSSKSGAGNTVNNGNNLNGYLNDIRIYDHCLSKAEVREIAKGLVLHYPLNNIYNTTATNLLTDTISSGYFSGIVSGTTRSRNEDGSWKYVINRSRTGTSDTTYNQLTGANASSWTAGKTYLFYCEIKLNYLVNLRAFWFRGSRVSNDWTTPGKVDLTNYKKGVWHKVYSIMQVPETFTRDGNTITSTGPKIEFWIYDVLQDGLTIKADYDIRNMMIVESSTLLPYFNNGFKSNIVEDCSGFGNNGTASNLEMNTDSPRYNNAVYFNGTNACIAAGRGAMVTDEITYSIWLNTAIATVRAISCTEGGGWNIETNSNSYLQAPIYASGAYRIAATTIKTSDLGLNTWHMLTVTWNGLQTMFYIDGELAAQSTALSAKTPITYNANNGLFIGAEAGANQTTPASYCQQKISDVRVYATALLADDVKLLYNRGASVDNTGKLHCGEIVENDTLTKQQIKKNTEVLTRTLSEIPNKYDEKVYVEPDGSMWLRIVRQNNPTSYKFASSDAFTTGVTKNNRNSWFYGAFCNYVDKWELMVKQVLASGGAEEKYRWVQSKNPMTAVFGDVDAADVTYVTSGYTTPSASYGGLYKHNTNTYLCANNSTSGNWFGAIGSWSAHNGGIPGWNGKTITTGYEDLYIRIDNVTITGLSNSTFKLIGDGDIVTTELNER